MRFFLDFLQIIEKNGSHEYGYVLIKKTHGSSHYLGVIQFCNILQVG